MGARNRLLAHVVESLNVSETPLQSGESTEEGI